MSIATLVRLRRSSGRATSSPLRQGHRADQPAAARLRAEPDLVRHRRASQRDHRLATDARAGSAHSPPLGAGTAMTTTVQHCRTHRHHRAAHRAAPVPARSLGRAAHRRPQSASRPGHPRLTPSLTAPTHPLREPGRGSRRHPDRHRADSHTPVQESPTMTPTNSAPPAQTSSLNPSPPPRPPTRWGD
jgi:hypothetical protein